MKKNLVATLAVGTEITDGQISDRNSQWLSARAIELGYEVCEHRAVPDDHDAIVQALRDLSRRASLIFVTGGLGPTSDDFTRECIAKFLDQPLEWDEASWQSILERLAARGAKWTENQKQQCFYPRGATILKNSNGTANGFWVAQKDGARIVTLPGPPGEIEVIWNEGLRGLLEISGGSVKSELTLLRTMGQGEGMLASRVEELISAAMVAGVERPLVGYRAHAPYVEIKLWADASQKKVVESAANSIRREFSEILVNENKEDLADQLLAQIATEAASGLRTMLFDGITNGELTARLFARANELKDKVSISALTESFFCVMDRRFEIDKEVLKPAAKTTVIGLREGEDPLELLVIHGAREKRITLPKLAMSLQSARGRKWAIEYALREWSRS